MNNIIHFSRFVPVTGSGGGARRTRQIVKLLESLHPEMVSAGRTAGLQNFTPAELGLGSSISLNYYSGRDGKLKYWSTFDLRTTGSYEKKEPLTLNKIKSFFRNKNEDKLWSPEHRQKVNRLRGISAEWARRIDLSRMSLALVDDPIYFLPLIEKLKETGVPLVAVSHNIESLASHQVNRQDQTELFNREIDALTKCDLVITISREEAWLLKNLNINAHFFPYYPPAAILKRLLSIRENRKKTKKKDFLLIGTTINEATRQGMFAVIDSWQKKKLFREGDRLLVAGFMSDIFLKDIKNVKNVEVLGPLPDEKLDRIMSTIKAAIVYQEWGSGALTRIMETLTAGVPALVNTHAARSYHNLDGVIEFHDLDELGTAFEKIEKIEGQVPMPPEPDPAAPAAAIKNLIRT
jgi:hypothetical protein